MADNLYEKFGSREIVDLMLERIDTVKETYESRRNFSASSILKGALTRTMVYPLDETGAGAEEGFEAYVFKNADILTHFNYDCDDIIGVNGVSTVTDENLTLEGTYSIGDEIASASADFTTISTYLKTGTPAKIFGADDVTSESLINTESGASVDASALFDAGYEADDITISKIKLTGEITEGGETTQVFTVTFTSTLISTEEASQGAYNINPDSSSHYVMDSDKTPGTHEFSYAEQVCMLFAKNQNLITKSGARYRFANPDTMFTGIEFNDNFAAAPGSETKVVVVGVTGSVSEGLYDIVEVNKTINQLTESYSAKAYDITYSDYAELLVENEMGFYVPQQLGSAYNKKTGAITLFDQNNTYYDFATARKGVDTGIYNAVNTWGDDTHYSINDAIDALKQKAKTLDAAEGSSETGFTRVFGGYKVTGKETVASPIIDDIAAQNKYNSYTINGVAVTDIVTGNALSSLYNLESVLNALATADTDGQVGQVRILSSAAKQSNRAIYVDPSSGALSNSAHIYLLTNVNAKSLVTDNNGIFEFFDKAGNKLFYQDKVFAGTCNLALITIGSYGLVFVVNKYGTKAINKIAWMINENGYATDAHLVRVVKNGLIHTVDCNEFGTSFDATCTVAAIKTRKITKNVTKYTPVLYLDTLKVTNLNQTAQKSQAEGGRGNGKLITWDYGKEITLHFEDALFTPASMAALWAGGNSPAEAVQDTDVVNRYNKYTAKRNFIVPAGNSEGIPSEGEVTAQAVYIDPETLQPYQDGTPIAKGEVYIKFTRSVGYNGNAIAKEIIVSAESFPGTYRVVGETVVRNKKTGKDESFQIIIAEAKMTSESTAIELSADGDPVVFSFDMDVQRPENGEMVKFVQFEIVENTEENDGSTMIVGTENLNLLDEAELYKVDGEDEGETIAIGATEY